VPEDELSLLSYRIRKYEKLLKDVKEKKDEKAIDLYSAKLALIKAKKKYLELGGNTLKTSDDLPEIEFHLKEKKTIIQEITRNVKVLPKNDVEYSIYKEIEKIIGSQREYLKAKHHVISEDRPVKELGSYMQLAEADGIDIIASPLEHEAELHSFKPTKREKRKKEFTIDFRKLAVVIAVFFLLLSLYFGIFWRKTPYDREIIRNYVVARTHFLSGNEYYVSGNFENSIREYATAAAFFNRASKEADRASSDESGKMQIYFANKRKFFHEWEKISLKMLDSSKEFQSGDPALASVYAVEVVDMAELAETYDKLAEEAWGLL
jgi:hypothetical protein